MKNSRVNDEVKKTQQKVAYRELTGKKKRVQKILRDAAGKVTKCKDEREMIELLYDMGDWGVLL